MIIRGTVAAVAACALLTTSCGSDPSESDTAGIDPSPSATSSALPTPAALAMSDVCPMAVQFLRPVSSAPKEKDLQVALPQLQDLSAQADPEAQSALTMVVGALEAALQAYADPAEVLPVLDAEESVDEGFMAFRGRCEDAGVQMK